MNLSISNLSKTYANGVRALQDERERDDNVAEVGGKTGAGAGHSDL